MAAYIFIRTMIIIYNLQLHYGILDQFRDIEEATYNYGVQDSTLTEGDIKIPTVRFISLDLISNWSANGG